MSQPPVHLIPLPWRFRGAGSGSHGSISALRFDHELELLWLGDLFGHVSTLTVAEPSQDEMVWHMYSSFRAFKDTCIAIEPFSSGKDALMCLVSYGGVRLAKRGGFISHRFDVKNTEQRRVFCATCDVSRGKVFVAGETPGLLCWTPAFGDAPAALLPGSVDSGCATLKIFEGILGGTMLQGHLNGDVTVRSLETMDEVRRIKAALPGRVTATDLVEGAVVVLSGQTDRTRATIRFFDLGEPEPLTPLHSVDVPSQTVGLSTFDNVSPEGEPVKHVMQLFANGYNIISRDSPKPVFSSSGVDGSCTAMAVSVNYQCCTIGSDKGYFFTLSTHGAGAKFQNSPGGAQPPQPAMPRFTAAWAENKDGILDQDFDYTAPEGELFSSWPPPHYMITSAAPKLRPALSRIPEKTITLNQWGIRRSDVYLPDPKDKLDRIIPDPYPFNSLLGDDPSKVVETLPKLQKRFRAEFGRTKSHLGMHSKLEEANQVVYQTDFEWKQYNSSGSVVGVDNSIFEAWIAPVLHIMFHLQPPHYPLRRAIQRHLCKHPSCIACELAFMFHNMELQSQSMASPIVPAHHLLTAMRSAPELIEAGIFERPMSRDATVSKLHVLQKWMLKRLEGDFTRMAMDYPSLCRDFDPTTHIVASFGTEFSAVNHKISPQFYWEVPLSATKVDEGLQHLLKQLETFNGEAVQIKRLPPILVLLLNPEHGSLKPPCSLKFSRPPNEEYNYVLAGNVVHLADDADDPGHFVTHCKVDKNNEFVLINDYFVSGRATEEVLDAHIPAVTTHSVVLTFYVLDTYKGPKWSHRGGDHRNALVALDDVAGDLLCKDWYAAAVQKRPPVLPSPITPVSSFDEIRGGHIVALDAEYVVLDWCNRLGADEPEWLRRQRKNNMSLARVSCILSRLPGDEQTIIDDFVATTEEVQDYVTQYSGIHEGDLDPKSSARNLTALKATYLKLRALVDRGVKLLGHGLAQDFRVLNICVPPDQVIDTLTIFSREGHRRFALRFLAYHVLGERVQEDCHDSVEDARTALRLFRRYEELESEGKFGALMDRLIRIGYQSNFSIPTSGPAPDRISPGAPTRASDASEQQLPSEPRTTTPSTVTPTTPVIAPQDAVAAAAGAASAAAAAAATPEKSPCEGGADEPASVTAVAAATSVLADSSDAEGVSGAAGAEADT